MNIITALIINVALLLVIAAGVAAIRRGQLGLMDPEGRGRAKFSALIIGGISSIAIAILASLTCVAYTLFGG